MQIELKASISEAIYTYDALQKRKPYLDQLMEGLEDFQLAASVRLFPSVFEPLFVNQGRCEAHDVLKIIHHKPRLSDREMIILNHVKRFVTECDTNGIIQT